MAFIKTRDNTHIYFKDWGSGKPVILIHGWPLSADSWDAIAIKLANSGFRAIAYDRRGFGRSDQPWSGYDYDTLSDDLADVMAALGVQDAALVGFSMGGGEVARYMSRHAGKNVSKAVLIGSIVPFMLKTDNNPDGVDQSVFDDILKGINEDRPKFFASFFKDFYGVGALSKPVSSDYIQWSLAVALQASLKATLDCVKAFSATDFRADLSAFKVPTLIIHGTADKTVPIEISAEKAARGITDAKLIEYKGEPHGVFATQTERLGNDLVEFLSR